MTKIPDISAGEKAQLTKSLKDYLGLHVGDSTKVTFKDLQYLYSWHLMYGYKLGRIPISQPLMRKDMAEAYAAVLVMQKLNGLLDGEIRDSRGRTWRRFVDRGIPHLKLVKGL